MERAIVMRVTTIMMMMVALRIAMTMVMMIRKISAMVVVTEITSLEETHSLSNRTLYIEL